MNQYSATNLLLEANSSFTSSLRRRLPPVNSTAPQPRLGAVSPSTESYSCISSPVRRPSVNLSRLQSVVRSPAPVTRAQSSLTPRVLEPISPPDEDYTHVPILSFAVPALIEGSTGTWTAGYVITGRAGPGEVLVQPNRSRSQLQDVANNILPDCCRVQSVDSIFYLDWPGMHRLLACDSLPPRVEAALQTLWAADAADLGARIVRAADKAVGVPGARLIDGALQMLRKRVTFAALLARTYLHQNVNRHAAQSQRNRGAVRVIDAGNTRNNDTSGTVTIGEADQNAKLVAAADSPDVREELSNLIRSAAGRHLLGNELFGKISTLQVTGIESLHPFILEGVYSDQAACRHGTTLHISTLLNDQIDLTFSLPPACAAPTSRLPAPLLSHCAEAYDIIYSPMMRQSVATVRGVTARTAHRYTQLLRVYILRTAFKPTPGSDYPPEATDAALSALMDTDLDLRRAFVMLRKAVREKEEDEAARLAAAAEPSDVWHVKAPEKPKAKLEELAGGLMSAPIIDLIQKLPPLSLQDDETPTHAQEQFTHAFCEAIHDLCERQLPDFLNYHCDIISAALIDRETHAATRYWQSEWRAGGPLVQVMTGGVSMDETRFYRLCHLRLITELKDIIVRHRRVLEFAAQGILDDAAKEMASLLSQAFARFAPELESQPAPLSSEDENSVKDTRVTFDVSNSASTSDSDPELDAEQQAAQPLHSSPSTVFMNAGWRDIGFSPDSRRPVDNPVLVSTASFSVPHVEPHRVPALGDAPAIVGDFCRPFVALSLLAAERAGARTDRLPHMDLAFDVSDRMLRSVLLLDFEHALQSLQRLRREGLACRSDMLSEVDKTLRRMRVVTGIVAASYSDAKELINVWFERGWCLIYALRTAKRSVASAEQLRTQLDEAANFVRFVNRFPSSLYCGPVQILLKPAKATLLASLEAAANDALAYGVKHAVATAEGWEKLLLALMDSLQELASTDSVSDNHAAARTSSHACVAALSSTPRPVPVALLHDYLQLSEESFNHGSYSELVSPLLHLCQVIPKMAERASRIAARFNETYHQDIQRSILRQRELVARAESQILDVELILGRIAQTLAGYIDPCICETTPPAPLELSTLLLTIHDVPTAIRAFDMLMTTCADIDAQNSSLRDRAAVLAPVIRIWRARCDWVSVLETMASSSCEGLRADWYQSEPRRISDELWAGWRDLGSLDCINDGDSSGLIERHVVAAITAKGTMDTAAQRSAPTSVVATEEGSQPAEPTLQTTTPSSAFVARVVAAFTMHEMHIMHPLLRLAITLAERVDPLNSNLDTDELWRAIENRMGVEPGKIGQVAFMKILRNEIASDARHELLEKVIERLMELLNVLAGVTDESSGEGLTSTSLVSKLPPALVLIATAYSHLQVHGAMAGTLIVTEISNATSAAAAARLGAELRRSLARHIHIYRGFEFTTSSHAKSALRVSSLAGAESSRAQSTTIVLIESAHETGLQAVIKQLIDIIKEDGPASVSAQAILKEFAIIEDLSTSFNNIIDWQRAAFDLLIRASHVDAPALNSEAAALRQLLMDTATSTGNVTAAASSAEQTLTQPFTTAEMAAAYMFGRQAGAADFGQRSSLASSSVAHNSHRGLVGASAHGEGNISSSCRILRGSSIARDISSVIHELKQQQTARSDALNALVHQLVLHSGISALKPPVFIDVPACLFEPSSAPAPPLLHLCNLGNAAAHASLNTQICRSRFSNAPAHMPYTTRVTSYGSGEVLRLQQAVRGDVGGDVAAGVARAIAVSEDELYRSMCVLRDEAVPEQTEEDWHMFGPYHCRLASSTVELETSLAGATTDSLLRALVHFSSDIATSVAELFILTPVDSENNVNLTRQTHATALVIQHLIEHVQQPLIVVFASYLLSCIQDSVSSCMGIVNPAPLLSLPIYTTSSANSFGNTDSTRRIDSCAWKGAWSGAHRWEEYLGDFTEADMQKVREIISQIVKRDSLPRSNWSSVACSAASLVEVTRIVRCAEVAASLTGRVVVWSDNVNDPSVISVQPVFSSTDTQALVAIIVNPESQSMHLNPVSLVSSAELVCDEVEPLSIDSLIVTPSLLASVEELRSALAASPHGVVRLQGQRGSGRRTVANVVLNCPTTLVVTRKHFKADQLTPTQSLASLLSFGQDAVVVCDTLTPAQVTVVAAMIVSSRNIVVADTFEWRHSQGRVILVTSGQQPQVSILPTSKQVFAEFTASVPESFPGRQYLVTAMQSLASLSEIIPVPLQASWACAVLATFGSTLAGAHKSGAASSVAVASVFGRQSTYKVTMSHAAFDTLTLTGMAQEPEYILACLAASVYAVGQARVAGTPESLGADPRSLDQQDVASLISLSLLTCPIAPSHQIVESYPRTLLVPAISSGVLKEVTFSPVKHSTVFVLQSLYAAGYHVLMYAQRVSDLVDVGALPTGWCSKLLPAPETSIQFISEHDVNSGVVLKEQVGIVDADQTAVLPSELSYIQVVISAKDFKPHNSIEVSVVDSDPDLLLSHANLLFMHAHNEKVSLPTLLAAARGARAVEIVPLPNDNNGISLETLLTSLEELAASYTRPSHRVFPGYSLLVISAPLSVAATATLLPRSHHPSPTSVAIISGAIEAGCRRADPRGDTNTLTRRFYDSMRLVIFCNDLDEQDVLLHYSQVQLPPMFLPNFQVIHTLPSPPNSFDAALASKTDDAASIVSKFTDLYGACARMAVSMRQRASTAENTLCMVRARMQRAQDSLSVAERRLSEADSSAEMVAKGMPAIRQSLIRRRDAADKRLAAEVKNFETTLILATSEDLANLEASYNSTDASIISTLIHSTSKPELSLPIAQALARLEDAASRLHVIVTSPDFEARELELQQLSSELATHQSVAQAAGLEIERLKKLIAADEAEISSYNVLLDASEVLADHTLQQASTLLQTINPASVAKYDLAATAGYAWTNPLTKMHVSLTDSQVTVVRVPEDANTLVSDIISLACQVTSSPGYNQITPLSGRDHSQHALSVLDTNESSLPFIESVVLSSLSASQPEAADKQTVFGGVHRIWHDQHRLLIIVHGETLVTPILGDAINIQAVQKPLTLQPLLAELKQQLERLSGVDFNSEVSITSHVDVLQSVSQFIIEVAQKQTLVLANDLSPTIKHTISLQPTPAAAALPPDPAFQHPAAALWSEMLVPDSPASKTPAVAPEMVRLRATAAEEISDQIRRALSNKPVDGKLPRVMRVINDGLAITRASRNAVLRELNN